MKYSIGESAKRVLLKLIEVGYSAYLVGGCVRDLIMQVAFDDVDIATSAKPSQVSAVFNRVIETGAVYGTVIVLERGEHFEVTTYRKDMAYLDGRRPVAIRFSDTIEEDLARRDFTMNAIAMTVEGVLVDPYSGVDDIKKRTIRCVGDANQRFKEDGLRKLRAVRFAAQKKFKLAEDVFSSLCKNPSLRGVSGERIFSELNKILLSDKPSIGFELLMKTGLLAEIDPALQAMVGFEQKNPNHIYDVFYHTLHVVDHMPSDLILRWAALLHDVGKPVTFTLDSSGVGHFYGHHKASVKIADALFDRLSVSNQFRKSVNQIIIYHMAVPNLKEKHIRRWMAKVGKDNIDKMIAFMAADRMGKGIGEDTYTQVLSAMVKKIKQMPPPFTRKDLAIDGILLMRKFEVLKQNKLYLGELLKSLLNYCIDDPLKNNQEALLAYSQAWLERKKMNKSFYDTVCESKNYILNKSGFTGEIGVILGSGLGDLVNVMTDKIYINYEDIPNFPQSTVEGHVGRLVFGKVANKSVLAMQGRFHYYEGYTMKEVTYPVYVMKMMGVKKIIVTNSCGGINTNFQPGMLMLIENFINLMGTNPLVGINDKRFGPRFPDMTEPYKKDWMALAKTIAEEIQINYGQGVYAGFTGPYYETSAEIKAYAGMGADAIGMSTVPETIVANYLGLEVLGIACITNMATGIQKKKHDHAHVVEMANKASQDFCTWVRLIIEKS